ncbi:4-carboxymuconolactone decarboxylase [Acrocarpospora corrugata]|uniref:4-carboxymuconolactone decarboxylase n=1 Tax=Acrocarpospora corrugata TaxID=35763 RepID=A0A5M3W0S5_9ACTN|nr:carboxymuconolactone decarboxylase family protein [Acrocarpospora corrugata]GES00903.1 4-carboxymuconolactone decarboxylase [Acrocarpospora corrugata]
MNPERFEAGLAMRKKVLGTEHVERSLAAVSDFSRPVQELVTEYCWGEIWTREGLDPRTRSLLNLAMLTALNRGHEFAVHVRGAIANGVTESEIQEALLQAAVYVGAPAALESFRIAERTLTELREQGVTIP